MREQVSDIFTDAIIHFAQTIRSVGNIFNIKAPVQSGILGCYSLRAQSDVADIATIRFGTKTTSGRLHDVLTNLDATGA